MNWPKWLPRLRVEKRGAAMNLGHPNMADPVLVQMFGGRPVASGVAFDEEGALSWSALSAGVRLSAETIGSMPWSVYENLPPRGDGLPGGRRERDDHAVHWLLHEEPNPEQTPMEFLELQQSHSLFWGNSYAQIVRNGAGIPVELWPLNPDRVEMKRDDGGDLWYRVVMPGGHGHTMLPAREVLHVRGFALNGLIGERLAQLHKEAIGLGIATELFSSSFFGQGANLSGFLSHPATLKDEAYQKLQESLSKRFEGLTNTHRIRILEEGMTWTPTGIDPEKAQLLMGRKFQVDEAARILRIPPHLLYDLERATFSNIEQQSLEFIRDHVRPWTVRREQRFNKQLFGRKERGRLFVKANMDAMLRADMKTRMDALQVAIQSRIMTPNEARALLDLNPGPTILDEFQMTPNLSAPSEQPAPTQDMGGANGDQQQAA